jgi:GGDEF domain-containing protein
LTDISQDQANQFAESVRLAVQEHRFEMFRELRVTVRIGVAAAKTSSDAEHLLKEAYEAVYEKKNHNKSQSLD